jgi:cardiolipin synthase
LLASNFIGGEKNIERHVERLYTLDDARFMNELGVLLGPPFLAGTRVQALLNGDQIFPPMLAAIRGARVSINFETYIYWSGDIGREFAEALAERARQGVKVHVLLDWVGSAKMDPSLISALAAAGVKVRQFHPPHRSHLGRLNNRTHRKLLIVDGRVGFTGGVGVAPPWAGSAQDPAHWRDSHFEVEGPVVAQMQSVFIDNWIKVTGDVLHGPDYFSALAPAGGGHAQMFSSSPSGGSESMQLMYLPSVTAASRSIDLSAAYFVPDELTLQALVQAMKRGVRLRIVVPGEHMDSETVRRASRAPWGPLPAAGAVIAEYGPTMYHSKVMIDAAFASVQTATFEADLAKSRRVTHAQWLARPWRERAVEALASVLGPQL